MQAAVIEAAGQLSVRDLPEPAMGAYQARCAMLFGAVCAGTDQHLVAGHQPFCRWFQTPAVLGHESIGRVTAVGAQVRHLRVGDLVTRVGTLPTGGVGIAWGGFAEVGIATDWQAMREDGRPEGEWKDARVQQVLPSGSDPAAATMIITWRETLSYLRRLGLQAGQRLLVVGSGGNGLAFAAHARHLGARAVVVGSAGRAAVCAALGAGAVDYRQDKPAEAAGAALGGQADVIVDAVGRAGGVDPYLGLLRDGGTLAVYGLDDLMAFRINPLAAAGSFRFWKGGYDEAEVHDEVVALMRSGDLDARLFLTNFAAPYPLARIAEALSAVRERRCIKALVRLG